MTKNCHHALAVDDDACAIYAVESILTSLGHRVTVAKNQEEAEALLDKERYCCALIDLELPAREGEETRRQTGFNIIERARRRFSAAELPIIAMTAHGVRHEMATRAFKMGATDYISKPFDQDQEPLDDKIRQALACGCEARFERCPNVRALEEAGDAPGIASRVPLLPRPRADLGVGSALRPAEHWLHLGGECRDRHYRIEFNGHEAFVCLGTFHVLARLAVGHLVDPAGWINGEEVHDNCHNALSRARKDLSKRLALKKIDFILNDGHGKYRLNLMPERLTYGEATLKSDTALCDLHELIGSAREGFETVQA